jgi:hypothetical protein
VRIESFVDTEVTLARYSDPIIRMASTPVAQGLKGQIAFRSKVKDTLMKTKRGGLYSLSTKIFGRAEYDRQLDQKWKNNAQSCVVSF